MNSCHSCRAKAITGPCQCMAVRPGARRARGCGVGLLDCWRGARSCVAVRPRSLPVTRHDHVSPIHRSAGRPASRSTDNHKCALRHLQRADGRVRIAPTDVECAFSIDSICPDRRVRDDLSVDQNWVLCGHRQMERVSFCVDLGPAWQR
jgi:hypothetical protein